MSRIISWFSCGAASAVATKLALIDNDVTIVYCEVKEEHPDNKRFLKDCEKWFGQEIIVLGNDKYKRSIDEVFWRRKYLAGIKGAPCTLLLKKRIREDFEKPGDVQVFGYTVEEEHTRVNRFIDANPYVNMLNPLIDKGLTKQDCLAMIENAGVELPEMYKLGYKNNNCCGCVKASSPAYWLKIKQDFRKRFDIMRAFEIMTGASICKATIDGVADVRIKLDEIPAHIKPMDDTVDIQCGIFCLMAEDDIANDK